MAIVWVAGIVTVPEDCVMADALSIPLIIGVVGYAVMVNVPNVFVLELISSVPAVNVSARDAP